MNNKREAIEKLNEFVKTLPTAEEADEVLKRCGITRRGFPIKSREEMKKLFEQQNKEDQKIYDILDSIKLRRFPIVESNSIWDYLSKQAQQDLDNKTLEDLNRIVNELALHGKKF